MGRIACLKYKNYLRVIIIIYTQTFYNLRI